MAYRNVAEEDQVADDAVGEEQDPLQHVTSSSCARTAVRGQPAPEAGDGLEGRIDVLLERPVRADGHPQGHPSADARGHEQGETAALDGVRDGLVERVDARPDLRLLLAVGEVARARSGSCRCRAWARGAPRSPGGRARAVEAPGQAEVLGQHLAQAAGAEEAQHHPDLQGPEGARHLGAVLEVVEPVVGLEAAPQVRGRDGERAAQALAVADQEDAAVVGHAQPLVGVEGQGVRALQAAEEGARLGKAGRQQAAGPVAVQPDAVARAHVGDRAQRARPRPR